MDNINHGIMIRERITESIAVKQQLADDPLMPERIELAAQWMVRAFRQGNRVFFCGNGGSAADAQHLAAELSGRFYLDRDPLPSEALHVNTSFLTAVSNDFSFEQAYARHIAGHGKKGDVLVALSTSGHSPNILKALKAASEKGMMRIGLSGAGGGKMKDEVDLLLEIPSKDTARIQEAHIMVGHIICEIVESTLFGKL